MPITQVRLSAILTAGEAISDQLGHYASTLSHLLDIHAKDGDTQRLLQELWALKVQMLSEPRPAIFEVERFKLDRNWKANEARADYMRQLRQQQVGTTENRKVPLQKREPAVRISVPEFDRLEPASVTPENLFDTASADELAEYERFNGQGIVKDG